MGKNQHRRKQVPAYGTGWRRGVRCGAVVALCLLLTGVIQAVGVGGGLGPQANPGWGWEIEPADDPKSFESPGDHPSALDASGRLHTAYGGDHLYYAWYDGVAWNVETVDPAEHTGLGASLALDSLGRPHIAYIKTIGSLDGRLQYAYYDGGTWQIEVLGPASQWNVSLALDGLDRPHIAYYDGGVLRWVHWDGAAWQVVAVDDTSQMGVYLSMALDSLGRPRIAYHNLDNTDLRYARFDGTTWFTETVDDAGYGVSIALDAAEQPHLSFWSGDGYLKYAHFDGSSWQIEWLGNPRLDWFSGSYTSLVLDSADQPHIGYGTSLGYAYRDGSGWHLQPVGESGQSGYGVALALDQAGRPQLTYLVDLYASSNVSALKYAAWDGTAWQEEVVDGEAASAGYNTSLALNAAGQPRIGYWRDDGLWYASCDDGSWQRARVDFIPGHWAAQLSLALDGAGQPRLAYCPFEGPYQIPYALKYARLEGTAWVTETVVPSGCWEPALDIDGSGHPHILYYQGAGSGGLLYAHDDGSAWITATVAISAGSGSLALDAAGRPHISYYDWGLSGLRYAYLSGTAWLSATVDTGYFYDTALALDAVGRPHIGYLGNDGVRYAYFDGTSWLTTMVDAGGRGDVSLAVDGKGWPHIAYLHQGDPYDTLWYARYDGAVWQTEEVDGIERVGGWYNISLALDAAGGAHISYFDQLDRILLYASRVWAYRAYLPVLGKE